MQNEKILLVEDDEKLGRQIAGSLGEAGYDVRWVQDGAEALGISPDGFGLFILDLMLPGAYGLDVLKELRRTSDLPVIILSARNETADKVRSLDLGADDYVTKPFWPEELLARVEARLRRPSLQRNGVLKVGDIRLDVERRSVDVGGDEVGLTRVEFDMLAALARRPGAAVSRASLARSALDPDREGTERTLDVHMSRLRKKLGSARPAITTVWGVGYRLDAEADT